MGEVATLGRAERGRRADPRRHCPRKGRRMIIAIDGPAACGKGTLGKRVAAHYGLAHLDTGTLYRAVARETLARGADPADAGAAASVARILDPASLADPGLRAQRLGETASVVARHPEVRE